MPSTRTLRSGITVLIPVRDRGRFLAQTLRSVRDQTAPIDEVVVVDDASTDDSAAVARESGATVVVNDGPPLGPAGARNLGLERVSTELVYPLDSDDILLPRAIEILSRGLLTDPGAPFAFGRSLTASRDASGWHPRGIIDPLEGDLADLLCSLFVRNFVPSCAVIIRTAPVVEVGGYAEDLPPHEDHHLWLRLAARQPPIYVPEIVSVARRHPGNISDPLQATGPIALITEMATVDPRLARCRPERLGVQLFEVVNAARKQMRPAVAARVAWTQLLREQHRRRILSAAARHARNRRQRAREARALWEASPDLRRSLASYE